MPKISRHSYDIAIVMVRRDHTSGVSVLKVYRPWFLISNKLEQLELKLEFRNMQEKLEKTFDT